MGRSVMTVSNAAAVVYFTDDEGMEEWEWDDLIENVQDTIKGHFPSFQKCEKWKWLADECRVILVNGHADITISEYCGLVAVCLVPYADYDGEHIELSLAWCNQIAGNWAALLNKAFGGLVKTGTGSNGEAFYKRIEG